MTDFLKEVGTTEVARDSLKMEVELGGMTKNLYHGIFLNYTGFTVYGGIFYFFHT